MLAGLPKAPSAYNPIVNPERATSAPALHHRPHARQRLHHRRAARRGAQAGAAATARRPKSPVHAEYVAETARQLIFSQYGAEAYTRGLNVYLTLDSAEQTLAYRALRKGIMDYERRQVYRGPEDYVDLPADPSELDARIAEALAGPSRQRRAAGRGRDRGVAEEGRGGAAERRVDHGHRRGPEAGDLGARRRRPTRRRRSARGAVVRVDPRRQGRLDDHAAARGRRRLRRDATRAPARSARWSAASTTRKSKFNHVTQAWRQPGSSFKPFIYSAALEKGFTPATVDQRRAAVLRRRRHRQPAVGAEELRRQVRRPDAAAPRRWPSRRT